MILNQPLILPSQSSPVSSSYSFSSSESQYLAQSTVRFDILTLSFVSRVQYSLSWSFLTICNSNYKPWFLYVVSSGKTSANNSYSNCHFLPSDVPEKENFCTSTFTYSSLISRKATVTNIRSLLWAHLTGAFLSELL